MAVIISFNFRIQIRNEVLYRLKIPLFQHTRIVVSRRKWFPDLSGGLADLVQAAHMAGSVCPLAYFSHCSVDIKRARAQGVRYDITLVIKSQKGRQVLWMEIRSSFSGLGEEKRKGTYGTISSCRPDRKRMGTSVIKGRWASEAHTWWQRSVRYFAGGMILPRLARLRGLSRIHTMGSTSSYSGTYSPTPNQPTSSHSGF
jgi:hypothetical protein